MTPQNLSNPELQLAGDFVERTGCHVFLTGKAGTGKTTFLHNLARNTAKRMIVTAPTGVAAINAGGVTLHSFFQLPFGPFVPGSETHARNQQRQFRFSREKKQIIKSLDLLVIDEISMVRADLLDAVDAVLRRLRRSELPFGGVQLLMIGDLHQLPPVARSDEWQLLQQYYDAVYFFASHALASTRLVTIRLQHIYRQSDAAFIRLLNRVRDNRLDPATMADLNRRCLPDFKPGEDQGYITLTTHNRSADTINASRLAALTRKKHVFKAEISGDFPEYLYPNPADLVLKAGAQVMFVRNDSAPEKRYYNGKIGKISSISKDHIQVVCPGDSENIVVEPVSWENIKYTVNPENREIEEEVIGQFKQYPLKLAWAITIHKSQGLTFDRAIIDAQAAFAHGQVYVALSRCKTLEGLVLSAPLSQRGVQTDAAIQRFDETAGNNPPDEGQLAAARIRYQQQLLLDCFDFQALRKNVNYLVRLLLGNAGRLQVSGAGDLHRLQETAVKDIFNVADAFTRQLQKLFSRGRLPEKDAVVLERIGKAADWFQTKLADILDAPVKHLHVDTDNAELRKRIGNALNYLKKELAVKAAGVKCCGRSFSPAAYLRAVSAAELDFSPEKAKKTTAPTYTEADIAHPELFAALKDWRSQKAAEKGVPHFQILHQKVLVQIVVHLPDNTADLSKIKGVGSKTIEKYGADILERVSAYREKHGIDRVVLPVQTQIPEPATPAAEKKPRGDTRQISLDLFNRGLTIDGIAEKRGLVRSTIETHLSFFVETGRLDIDRLVSPEKQALIQKELAAGGRRSLGQIKHALGDDCSYAEIKMVRAFGKDPALK